MLPTFWLLETCLSSAAPSGCLRTCGFGIPGRIYASSVGWWRGGGLGDRSTVANLLAATSGVPRCLAWGAMGSEAATELGP